MPVADNVTLGSNVRIFHPELVNIYGCKIGDGTQIGPFVEIQSGAEIGQLCKISSHSFICEGVIIQDEVFVGHGVMFINDIFPRATDGNGKPLRAGDWTMVTTCIGRGSSIGSNATIMGGITIGKYALIGAGAVVTKNVPDYTIVAGVPARVMGDVREKQQAQTE